MKLVLNKFDKMKGSVTFRILNRFFFIRMSVLAKDAFLQVFLGLN